ncbi:TPA: AAA family ATPase [Escherichia coli]|nr:MULTISPECIES: AAA family ATPase [Enterobacteriaceae]ELK6460861.1 AAA family ATPase [Enterobacter ludwigii]HBR1948831.1 AAA family ATPase [Klebsiella quasipneumoniae subsp. quasipneumoniae]HED2338261.1 AAA family ATPase [Serratia liquefaciens]HEO9043402.1 AAA family ATPase [Enterobacter kobei]EFH3793655.1 AAA family ATPase [Escherichia coli]
MSQSFNALPSILEKFEVLGMNSYKNISISFENNVKIISAENGTGKTTILTFLYSLLTGKVSKLIEYDFESINIKFRNSEEMSISKKELFPNFESDWYDRISSTSIAFKRIKYHGVTPNELYELAFLAASGYGEDFFKCRGYKKLYDDSPLDNEDIRALCEDLLPQLIQSEKYEGIESKIKESMGDLKVLYLPTFRRIESEIPEFEVRKTNRNGVRRMNSKESDWDNGLMFFGLNDVESRLKYIENDIRRGTFESYSKISARTLKQLLTGGSSSSEIEVESIDLVTLNVVLSRLGMADEITQERIKTLTESGEIKDAKYESLRSFLGQLVEIYQEKMEYEQALESFVQVVDSYWNVQNAEKRFSYDKSSITARVINQFTKNPLPLGSLSSGEKQIVSVFARLYLDMGKKYLVLIDEPELSLSIDWQQKFLPDILKAPSCEQLIAITHSPFTFENELDRYAGFMRVSYNKPSEGQND